MREAISFSAWQDADQTPEVCPLCREEQPIFEYRITPGEAAVDQGQKLQGYCCLHCGQQLLATTAELILACWARKSADKPEKTEQ